MPNVRRAAHGRRDFQLEFRDSLAEMDSRLRGNDEDGRDARAPRSARQREGGDAPADRGRPRTQERS